MRINPDDVRRHYQSMSDGEILAIDRNELTDVAQAVYDEEIARRGLGEGGAEGEEDVESDGEESGTTWNVAALEDGEVPDWLDDAAAACSFTLHPGSPAADRASQARAALRDAGIPSHITVTREESGDEDLPDREIISVMVPGALALHATSILDRDLFNDEFEADWRTHLDALSDDDLLHLDPRVFCAGFLDRVARMKRAYSEEMSRRKLRAIE